MPEKARVRQITSCQRTILCSGTSVLDEAIRLNPEYAEAYYNRGLAYKIQDKKAEAIADFEKFITLTDDPQRIQMARQHIEELSK